MSFNKSDIKKVAKSSAMTFIGASLGRGVFFLTQVLIARLLGVEYFGLYTIGFSLVKLCEILASLGLKAGGMRFVSIYNNKDEHRLKGILLSAALISIINGAIVGSILYALSTHISELFFHNPALLPTIKLFAFSIPFVTGMNVVASLLQGFQTTKYTIYSREFIQPLSNILLIVIFYYTGFELSGIIYAFIISHIISLGAGVYYSSRLFPDLLNNKIKSIFEIKKLISYSMPLLMLGFMGYFITWTDILMLGYLGSSKDVGIYRAASQLPLMMTLLVFATNSIYAPMAADLYHGNEMERLGNILKATTRWVSYATIPIFIFLIFSSRELMTVFGKEYIDTGSSVLIILSFSHMFDCMTGSVQATLNMTSKQKIELMNISGTVMLSIILNYVLIPQFGAIGAAAANCIAITFINVLRVFEIHHMYKIHPFSMVTLKYLIPGFYSIITILLLKYLLTTELNFMILIITKLSIILMIFTLYLLISFDIMNEEDRFIIDKIRSKLQFHAM
jgi:O-antigen/teichoic acid export membrane protein